jgi:hypothetical protein
MGLTMNERQAVTKQLALEYKRATKKNKCRILDSLVRLAGGTPVHPDWPGFDVQGSMHGDTISRTS